MENDLSDQLADAWLRLFNAHVEVEGVDETVRDYNERLEELKEAARSYYRVIERMERVAREKTAD